MDDDEHLEEGDLVRCVVTGFTADKIFTSIDQERLKELNPLLSLSLKLGACENKDLPLHAQKVFLNWHNKNCFGTKILNR